MGIYWLESSSMQTQYPVEQAHFHPFYSPLWRLSKLRCCERTCHLSSRMLLNHEPSSYTHSRMKESAITDRSVSPGGSDTVGASAQRCDVTDPFYQFAQNLAAHSFSPLCMCVWACVRESVLCNCMWWHRSPQSKHDWQLKRGQSTFTGEFM